MKQLFQIFLVLLANPLYSQDTQSIIKQARLLYSYEEYTMAIRLYDSLLNNDPADKVLQYEAGNCYLSLKNPDKAISYYRNSLAVDPLFPDAVFNLGSAFDMKMEPDSSIKYFKRYASLNDSDPEVFNRLSNIFLDIPGMEDSAVYYAGKALELNPANADSYFSMAYAFFNNSQYNESLYTALKGLEADSGYSFLYMPAGLSSYFLGDYNSSMQYFKKGWETQGFEEIFAPYYAQSMLLANTDQILLNKTGDNFFFKEINSENLKNWIGKSLDTTNEYYYPSLLRNFKASNLQMGMDQFIMLYIGFTNDKAYSPYSIEPEDVMQLWDNEQFDEFLTKAELMVSRVPVDYILYLYISEVYKLKGNYEAQFENLFKYYGFSRSILATGSGKSKKEAIIVAYIDHEYGIISELGLTLTGQTLVQDKSTFDVISVLGAENIESEIYFNIDIPFSTLNINPGKKSRKKGRK